MASATDRWVDAETGSNAGGNTCKVQANPCATIMQAGNNSQSEGNFGTIHVDQGTYNEAVIIAQGNVLDADDFVPGDSGPTRIAYTGAGVAAFPQANATIQGFEISGTSSSTVALVSDNAKLLDNTITASATTRPRSTCATASGHPPPRSRATRCLADSGDDGGRACRAARPPRRPGSSTTRSARRARTASTRASGSATTRSRRSPATRSAAAIRCSAATRGASSSDRTGDVTVSGNLVTSPVIAAGQESDGIYVNGMADGATVSLDHNTVRAMTGIGVVVLDTDGSTVNMEGDLVVANSDRAMYVGNVDDMTITNATIGGNQPVVIGSATVGIDSSIFDTPITDRRRNRGLRDHALPRPRDHRGRQRLRRVPDDRGSAVRRPAHVRLPPRGRLAARRCGQRDGSDAGAVDIDDDRPRARR